MANEIGRIIINTQTQTRKSSWIQRVFLRMERLWCNEAKAAVGKLQEDEQWQERQPQKVQ